MILLRSPPSSATPAPRILRIPAGTGGPPPRIDVGLLEGNKKDVPVVLLKKPTEGQRIAALPVVDYWHPEVVAMAMEWARANWLRPGAKRDFLPTQAVALLIAHLEGGLLAQAAVGIGKTLISFLISDALGAASPILFVPASVRIKTQLEWHDYNRDFKLPTNLQRMAYEELSTASNSDVLDRILKDCIIMDECHKLRRVDAARTKRVQRYMEKHPGVKCVALSGTLTSTTIADYCLAPSTRVLTDDLRWVPVETLQEGDSLIGFDEALGRGKMKTSVVERVGFIQQPRLRITTTRGTVVCSTLHGWVRCARLATPVRVFDVREKSTPSNVMRQHRGARSERSPFVATVVVAGRRHTGPPRKTAEEASKDASQLRATHNSRQFDEDGVSRGKATTKVRRHWAQAKDLHVGDEVAFYVEPWEYDTSREGGYLAGLLDGEGWVSTTNNSGQVGFAQKPGPVLDAYCAGLSRRGFTYSNACHSSGVHRVYANGEAPHMRLLGMLRPVRLMAKARRTWEGKASWGKNTERAVILKIEEIGDGDVVAVQTTTRTLVAEGFLTHNSHFAKWCLKRNAPVPLETGAMQSFRIVLDVKPVVASEADGETRFAAVHAPANQNWLDFSPLWPGWSATAPDERQAEARKVWARRLASSPGVLVTTDPGVSCGLVFRHRRVDVPRRVSMALEKLEATWCRDDGEELTDAVAFYRVASQMAQGFYYRWVWPDGEVDEDWLRTRSEWHSIIRSICKRSIPHCDSDLLVRSSLATGRLEAMCPQEYEEAKHAHEMWVPHSGKRWHGKPHPPVETVWLDPFLIDDTLAWFKEHPRGLAWYTHGAVAEALTQRGVRVYGGGGMMPPTDGKQGMALSILAHGTGKNLQAHHENLFLSFPTSGEQAEQLIGRTHRQGQTADDVFVDYYDHVGPAKRAIDQAKLRATYMRDSTGTPQKLLYGTWE